MVSLNVAQSLSQLSPVAFPEYSYGIVDEFRLPFGIAVLDESLLVPFIGDCPWHNVVVVQPVVAY